MGAVNVRRLLPLLALLALIVAPFGRMAAAEAMAAPAHAGMAGPGHCQDMPAPDEGSVDKRIDCMIACAVMASAEVPAFDPPQPLAAEPEIRLLAGGTGIRPEADPPPPRLS